MLQATRRCRAGETRAGMRKFRPSSEEPHRSPSSWRHRWYTRAAKLAIFKLMTRHSIVIPVYLNERNLPELLTELEKLGSRLGSLEVVFVVDGSPDESLTLLRRALPSASFESRLARLSRNFGAFSAIRAGLEVASGEYIAVMAADLQEPPEAIVTFFTRLDDGDCDIVVGSRLSREDPLMTRAAASLYWRAYKMLVQPDIPPGGVDIFACTRQVRDVIVSLDEQNTSLIGLLYWVGFARDTVPYERRARLHGKSAWTFGRKLKYMTDSVFAFSDLPIRLIVAFGTLGVTVSVLVSLAVFISWITGATEVKGYTPIILAIFFFGTLITLAVGVLGSYVFRTYENTKRRPPYIIASIERFGAVE
jgi:polyisoprenyl-phosphate glycosyltransferase